MGQNQSSKRSRVLGSCLLLLAVGLAPACAGSSTGSAPVTVQQLPSQLAVAICDNIGGCCQTAAVPFDLATCKANVAASLTQSLQKLQNDPSITYDANAAADCVEVYGAQVKSCLLNESAIESACGGVFVGALPLGAACAVDTECKSPAGNRAYCDVGTCALLDAPDNAVHGKLGEACGGTCDANESCSGTAPSGGSATPPTTICYKSDGLFCGASQTCEPLFKIGQPCDFDDCVAGAICLGNTCAAGLPVGAPCTDSQQCADSSCVFASGGPGADSSIWGNCGALAVGNAAMCAGNFQ